MKCFSCQTTFLKAPPEIQNLCLRALPLFSGVLANQTQKNLTNTLRFFFFFVVLSQRWATRELPWIGHWGSLLYDFNDLLLFQTTEYKAYFCPGLVMISLQLRLPFLSMFILPRGKSAPSWWPIMSELYGWCVFFFNFRTQRQGLKLQDDQTFNQGIGRSRRTNPCQSEAKNHLSLSRPHWGQCRQILLP